MKFGEKYELLESLTTGGVETFVANDKVRGERVLVHIIEGEAQKPNQPTVQWVLEAFRRVAPEPPGLVLETGRYSGTLYAYLVTKMPDDAALRRWVRLYRSHARETQEIAPSPGKPTPESESPTADMEPKAASPAPGSVTQLFRELDPDSKPGGPGAPLQELSPEPSTSMEQPSRLLRNVEPALDRSAVRPAAPDSDAAPPGISVPAKVEPKIRDSANSFSSAFTPRNVSPELSRTSKEGPRPGEFTSFFQGPFRVEGPSETPVASPQTAEPPRKSVGDFTAMFNRPLAEEPPPAQGVAGNEPAGSGFTGWFSSPNIVSRTSGTPVAPPSAFERSVAEDLSVFPAPKGPIVPSQPLQPPQPASYVAPALPVVSVPAPPIFPNPTFPNPTIEKPPAAFAPDGATNAFNRPAAEPAPSQSAPPSSPGAYTQIISARPAGPAGSSKPVSPNSPASPGFPTPSMPAIAPPPMPPAPAMPKIALPPPPKAPKLDKVAVPEPSVSYWPLILTLTVLFFIAALLVLYFVLKH